MACTSERYEYYSNNIHIEVYMASRNPLKSARLYAALTQAQLAKELGVSQPTYQRWETGGASIPKGKIEKLARILEVTPQQLLGKPESFDLFGGDPDVADERTYFGEVAIHFRSNSPSLLLPVSEAERSSLHRSLQSDDVFIEMVSLDNRTLFVRRAAIADVFFSSEAYDDYGPEEYGDQLLGIFPDNSFWRIVDGYDAGDDFDGEFEEKEIERVFSIISLSDDDVNSLIAEGHLTEDQRESTIEDASQATQKFIDRARSVVWQLPGGRVRNIAVHDGRTIYDAFSMLPLLGQDEMVHLAPDGYHRSIFIDPSAVDFISVPTQKYREGTVESHADDLGEEM
jgi:transcriptional regulator with XRE-family HTH domain